MAGKGCLSGILLVIITCSLCIVHGIRVDEFYPLQDGKNQPQVLSSRVSVPFPLGTAYNIYGKPYRSLRVSYIVVFITWDYILVNINGRTVRSNLL